MIQNEIENNLTDGMDLLHLEVENESPNHNVEPGSESHFKVVVVSDEFVEKRLVQMIKCHSFEQLEAKVIC